MTKKDLVESLKDVAPDAEVKIQIVMCNDVMPEFVQVKQFDMIRVFVSESGAPYICGECEYGEEWEVV